MTAREASVKFTVTSGCLCFGALHNIWHGASDDMQEGFPASSPVWSGTVKAQEMKFSLPAQNGIWNAFQLVEAGTNIVTAWFVCHSDVEPDREVDKILRVSGSPYEPESGDHSNCEETKTEGVFVINRYDWDYYDQRSADVVGETASDEDRRGNSLGLVDYAHAKDQVTIWKSQKPSERSSSETGIWMRNDRGEYLFGRFGFNDTHSAAQSFLLFTTYTQFDRTTFAGVDRTLRKQETDEERFQRLLLEGYDFSGLKYLRKMAGTGIEQSKTVGPYDCSYHILRAQDIETLRQTPAYLYNQLRDQLRQRQSNIEDFQPEIRLLAFPPTQMEAGCDLLNELMMTWLDQHVLPHALSSSTQSIPAEALFPRHMVDDDPYTLEKQMYRRFVSTSSHRLHPEFDTSYVEERILNFLLYRSGDRQIALGKASVAGLCRVIAFLLLEILELASNSSISSGIVPSNVRTSVYYTPELFCILKYCYLFWNSRN